MLEAENAALRAALDREREITNDLMADRDAWKQQATALLAAKEYDNAIESFTRLLNTSLHDKARGQIDEAAKLAAQDDRQKAADQFVRAANTRDPESKRKLLLSSRELLQGILIKYPQSGLTEKVQRNLTGVERELKAADAAASAKGPAS